MILTFIDTETTGLPKHFPKGDGPEITEYCLATWTDGVTTDLVHVRVMPQAAPKADPSTGVVRTVDGFPLSFRYDTWEAHNAKPWSAEDNRAMFSRLHGKHVGGSNPRFDLDRVRFELERFSKVGSRPEPHHRIMDLNALGFPLWVAGLVESTGLVALAKYFEIEHDAHTSNGDVLASIAVFERLLDEFLIRPKRLREFVESICEMYETDDPSFVAAAREALA